MANVVIALTYVSGSTKWTVPADCNSIQIEIIGSGHYVDTTNGTGGGGGAYTKLTGFSVTPGAVLTYSLGNNNGQAAWISNTGAFPVNTSQGALAQSAPSSVGGPAANCIPSVGAFSGGNAGFTPGFDLNAYGGGGGAAGPNGNGANGGDAFGTSTGGGGGGANGGSAGANAASVSVGGAGGNGRGGTGGGTAGSGSAGGTATTNTGGGGGGGSSGFAGGAGAQENIWQDWRGNFYGPGGGNGGPGDSGSFPTGTGYGAGNYNGTSNGLIIITYAPVAITGGPYTEVFTLPYSSSSAYNPIQWRTPLGVTSIQVEAIGGGGIALDTISGRGGGGGAYAKTTSLAVTPGDTAYVRPAYTPTYGTAVYSTPVNSWFNRNSNTAPGNTSVGVLAAGAASGLGGTAANCIGVDLKYSGGNGGLNNTTATGGKFRGGGGGGAAGPSGAGQNGGAGYNTGTGAGTGGGGGGSNGGSSTAGGAGAATVGGAGGSGTGGTGGGAGGTSTTSAVEGTANTGGGGGGGSTIATSFRYDGKAGGTSNVWTIGGSTYGPSGGSGGAGCTSAITGQAGYSSIDLNYGGGIGSGSSPPGSSTRGFVVITYSAVATIPAISARLFSTGTLAIANTMQFNEIAQNTASIQSNVVYSSLFDEVSQSAVAMRILSNGSIQVSTSFDEVTGIS